MFQKTNNIQQPVIFHNPLMTKQKIYPEPNTRPSPGSGAGYTNKLIISTTKRQLRSTTKQKDKRKRH